MTNTIIFSWPEKSIERTASVLDFRAHFAHLIGDCPLFSGEFDPPIHMDNKAKTKLDKVHFSDISFLNGRLYLFLDGDQKKIDCRSKREPLKFKVITPGKK